MWKYILKRLVYLIPTLLGISIIVFTIVRLIPGDPVEILLGQRTTGELVEIYRRQLGLDRPIYVQYILWLRNILTGNWGQSLLTNAKVSYLIFKRFQYTLQLALLVMAINTGLGILFGTLSAYKAGTRIDQILRFFNIFGWSLPQFLVGIVLIYIFALNLKILPPLGGGSVAHLVLPAMTISVGGISWLSRITRGSALEVAGQDFVKTAQAKGVRPRTILLRHILRNSLLPVITVLGMSFGWSLSGSFVVEQIFSYPGIGHLAVQSISYRDYPVVQGCVLFFSVIYSLSNLVVDILYVYLDPRVRYERFQA